MLARSNYHHVLNLKREDGTLTESKEEVTDVLVSYFNNLFGQSTRHSPLNSINVAPFIDKHLD